MLGGQRPADMDLEIHLLPALRLRNNLFKSLADRLKQDLAVRHRK